MRTWMLAVACTFIALAGCQRDPSPAPVDPKVAAPDPCLLRVGWDPWEPYQFEGPDGAVAGLDVEIVRQLAGDAGCSLEFVRGSWLELLGQLRDGRVHLLMAATPTADRQAYARFSQPYRRESFALFARAEDAAALKEQDLQQLARAQHRIAVTDGYYYGESATQVILDEATSTAFVAAPIVELNYTRLVDGDVDALLDDPFVAAAVLRRKGWTDRIVRLPLEIHSGEVSLMYSKSGVSAETAGKLDAALAAHKADGSLRKLIDRYQG